MSILTGVGSTIVLGSIYWPSIGLFPMISDLATNFTGAWPVLYLIPIVNLSNIVWWKLLIDFLIVASFFYLILSVFGCWLRQPIAHQKI